MPKLVSSYEKFKESLYKELSEVEFLDLFDIDTFMLLNRFEDLVKERFKELGGVLKEDKN